MILLMTKHYTTDWLIPPLLITHYAKYKHCFNDHCLYLQVVFTMSVSSDQTMDDFKFCLLEFQTHTVCSSMVQVIVYCTRYF